MAARFSALFLALVVSLAACSATTTPSPTASLKASVAGSASPSSTTAATPSSTPSATPSAPAAGGGAFTLFPADEPPGFRSEIRCRGEIGANDSVALVELNASLVGPGRTTVLRDYADVEHPRTVCTFAGFPTAMIDARHVVISICTEAIQGCRQAIVDLPEVRYHWFALPRSEHSYAELVAVSPRLDEVAWFKANDTYETRRLMISRADGNHAVVRLQPAGGRCGSIEDSKLGAYTRSGDRLWVLDVPIANQTTFAVLRGTEVLLRMAPPTGGWQDGLWPAFPVWAPDGSTLFFRRGPRGYRWTPSGGLEAFPAAANWRWPSVSPDGRYLAWARPRDDGHHDIYLMDLRAGTAPRRIAGGRSRPVFLNDRQLWYQTENDHGCVGDEVRQRVYDVTNGVESQSIVAYVQAVWPTSSSNY